MTKMKRTGAALLPLTADKLTESSDLFCAAMTNPENDPVGVDLRIG
jgi:hypothetical protein